MNLTGLFRAWALTHLLFTGVGIFLAYLSEGWSPVPALALGSFLMAASLGIMAFSIQQILLKKHVAVYGMVIVSKYATFGAFIYLLVSKNWISPIWFGAGVLVAVLSLVVSASWAVSKGQI